MRLSCPWSVLVVVRGREADEDKERRVKLLLWLFDKKKRSFQTGFNLEKGSPAVQELFTLGYASCVVTLNNPSGCRNLRLDSLTVSSPGYRSFKAPSTVPSALWLPIHGSFLSLFHSSPQVVDDTGVQCRRHYYYSLGEYFFMSSTHVKFYHSPSLSWLNTLAAL